MILEDDYTREQLDEQERALAESIECDMVRASMGSELCRQFMWEVFTDCRLFGTTFNSDHALMSFYEGRRSVGLRLMALAQRHAPDLYEQMTRENSHRGMK